MWSSHRQVVCLHWPHIISPKVMTALWWQPLEPDPPVWHALPRHSLLTNNCRGVIFCPDYQRGYPGASPWDSVSSGADRASADIRPLTSGALSMHSEPSIENTVMASSVDRMEWDIRCLSFGPQFQQILEFTWFPPLFLHSYLYNWFNLNA